jgi:transcriptional regulator with XRE-family HTH domain
VAAKKGPNPIDKHVGSRVRMRRKMVNLSQKRLGEALALTFQQVQKYEKGINRIGASRLQQIATILQVPVSFFFEGAPKLQESLNGNSDTETMMHVSEFLASTEGLSLSRAFTRITEPSVRRRILTLVQEIAGAHPQT